MSHIGIPIYSFLINSTIISLYLHYPKTEFSIKSSTSSLSSTLVGPYSSPLSIENEELQGCSSISDGSEFGSSAKTVNFTNFIRNRDFSCSVKTDTCYMLVDMETETMILALTILIQLTIPVLTRKLPQKNLK